VQANVALGLPVDARDNGAAADFLIARGVRAVRLLTNNPDKVAALTSFGVACDAGDARPAQPAIPAHQEPVDGVRPGCSGRRRASTRT